MFGAEFSHGAWWTIVGLLLCGLISLAIEHGPGLRRRLLERRERARRKHAVRAYARERCIF